MYKQIKIDNVHYAMLEVLSKKANLKPDQFINKIIKESYNAKR
jgi:hypothetical protein